MLFRCLIVLCLWLFAATAYANDPSVEQATEQGDTAEVEPEETQEEKVKRLLDEVAKFGRYPKGEVVRELITMGPVIAEPVSRRLRKTDKPHEQKHLLTLLYAAGGSLYNALVAQYLDEKSRDVRLWALYNLARYGDNTSIPFLIGALDDSSIPLDAKELAVDRLKTLTGQNIDYQASMDRDQRRRAFEAWQEWYERESAFFN